MTWVDYITVMLANMLGALLLLAAFVVCGIGREDRRAWAPPFLVTGLIALVTGLHMTITWPIPAGVGQAYNAAFGETTVLFGALLLGAGIALGKNWSLQPLSVLAVPAGAVAIVIGALILKHEMTRAPAVSAVGFIAAGAAGLIAPAVVYCRAKLLPRLIGAALLLIAAAVWALTTFGAYIGHFARWQGS